MKHRLGLCSSLHGPLYQSHGNKLGALEGTFEGSDADIDFLINFGKTQAAKYAIKTYNDVGGEASAQKACGQTRQKPKRRMTLHSFNKNMCVVATTDIISRYCTFYAYVG